MQELRPDDHSDHDLHCGPGQRQPPGSADRRKMKTAAATTATKSSDGITPLAEAVRGASNC